MDFRFNTVIGRKYMIRIRILFLVVSVIIFFSCDKKVNGNSETDIEGKDDLLEKVEVKKINRYMWMNYVDGAQMRAELDLYSKKLLIVPDDEKVFVVKEAWDELTIDNRKGKWSKVIYKGKEGWIFGGFLTMEKDAFLSPSHELIQAITDRNLGEVERLIFIGVDMDTVRDESGLSAFLWAASCIPENLDLFISAGANINTTDNSGFTALMFAVRSNRKEVVKILLDYGADVNIEGNEGLTAFWLIDDETDIEIVELLLSGNTDVNLKEDNEGTALIIASSFGRIDIIKLLLANGVDVNFRDNDGKTALFYAKKTLQREAAELLISAGAIE